MPNLSIKNVPEHVVEKLRQRALSHRRSLQAELLDLVCRASEESDNDNTSIEQEGQSSEYIINLRNRG